IERHGADDDPAGHELLHPVGQPFLRAADLNQCHDGRATSVPATVPRPPKRLPPPMMTAAITSSSRPTATVGSPTDSFENCRTPPAPANAAAAAYTATLHRSTLTPQSRAMRSFEPMAKSRRPNRV